VIKRLRTLGERDWRTLDRVLAAGMSVAMVLNVMGSSAVEGPVALNLLVNVPMGATLLYRRDRPLFAMSAYVVLATIGTVWLTGPPDLAIAVLILIILSYSVGAHTEARASWAGLGIAAGAVIGLTLVYDPSDIFFPTVFFSIVPWFVGRVIRGQVLLARELSEKAERAERERDLGEARAIADERRRVARELHDVLAHDLSVMVVQASAARRIADRHPEQATEAARLIERTGREALAELRHLFGAVRRGEGEELGAPGLAGVDRLAERARHAGLPVELRIEGDRRELPPGVDLAAYRVIQEALTNSLKHAGSARADVLVRYSPAMLTLEITDDGVGPNGSESDVAPGGGHGLVGMRERVALYGGELDTGRRRGGGFAVRARLPLNGGGG
jgi:signal transduction histidine kinase